MAGGIGVVASKRFLLHEPDEYHIEHPMRLSAIHRVLDAPPWHSRLRRTMLQEATIEQLSTTHDIDYINEVAGRSAAGKGYINPDTYINEHSYRLACLAAGSCIALADSIVAQEVESGIAFVRPPGHHAERNQAKGFCLFNNLAVTAHHLLWRHGLERILIVDWDLHHGNGTQDAFYGDDRVLFFSTHQFPFFPGSGWVSEIGTGKGMGFTINVPFAADQGNRSYLTAFEDLLIPVAERFAPQFILVSHGFDILEHDPIGSMRVSIGGLIAMLHALRSLARRSCQGRLQLILEGGYDLRNLREGTRAMLEYLCDDVRPAVQLNDHEPGQAMVRQARTILRDYWPVLE
ncbi:histone deacetylase [bacterium]|nr:histone deacetylase [candidate division CSSED10-310 bacterium]